MLSVLNYIDGKTGFLFFERGSIVYRSLHNFRHLLNPNGPDRFEWEIYGLTATGQPYSKDKIYLTNVADELQHPNDCVMDVNATIELLKYRIIDHGLIHNLRNRKCFPPS